MELSPELTLGILTGITGIVVALIGWFGRKDEVKAQSYKTLLEGQDKRIDRLEGRLEKVELELRDTKTELGHERDTVWTLRKFLGEAVNFADETIMNHGGVLFRTPDVDKWRAALAPSRPRWPLDE